MSNIEKALFVLLERDGRDPQIRSLNPWDYACHATRRRDDVQALANAGLLAPEPKIIHTVEELWELAEWDGEARLITRKGVCRSARWFDGLLGNEIGRVILLPAAVVATGAQVRAARKALEQG